MNIVEKLVYDIVKGNPKLKLYIRNQYQSLFDLLPRKKDWSINKIELKPGFFYGFHDLSPFSADDSMLLANMLTIPLRKPEKNDPLKVGYFNLSGFSQFTEIGQSHAWNYHKGCRLQWVGRDKIIYNDAENNTLVSRLYSLETGKTRTIPEPVDSVDSAGKTASFFSYERLEKLMPGYGYPYTDSYSYLEENAPDNSGIYTINLDDGSIKLHKTIKELSLMPHVPDAVKDEMFFVTHSLFSHDGQYLSFLFRSTNLNNTNKRWSSLLVLDLNTGECSVAPTDGMVSHYVWNTKNQIIAYCRVDGIDSHVLFENPSLTSHRRIAYPTLNSDGHQSFVSDDVFVTDTYPDKYRIAHLYKVNADSNEVLKLASVNSPKKFQSRTFHSACDLHPRMNRKGDVICFDSVHTGERSLCLMKIE